MNDLQIFTNEQFGNVRVVDVNGDSWFVAADVCKALELGNPTMALDRLDADERTLISIEGASNGLPVNMVNEAGLYSLVLGSRKPEAKAFKRWITHEVIPAIRKHGGYLTPEKIEEALLNPDTIIRLATDLKAERAARIELQEQNAAMLPLVKFAKAATDSEDTVDMATVAKVLNFPSIGRNKLFEILRNNGILDWKNDPYQRYVNDGWFKCTESVYYVYGEPRINIKTAVYQRGMMKIRELLEKVCA